MANEKNNVATAAKNETEVIKKEIAFREENYKAMDSEKARKDDTKATYRRYMRQAEGNHPMWTAIAAGLFVVFIAMLGYAILESVNGNMSSALWVVVSIICAVCAFGIVVIAVRDITKRKAEAQMRLSSHIHRYDMQLKHLKVEIDELNARLAELEKGAKK